jgi:molybdopterin/thiamine biosynthesis adenylyltransferase
MTTSDRYARQIILQDIGKDGQKALASARVLVVGAGGLGSFVLPILAGAGVGRIEVVDHDRVELSNLHRQPLFRMDDIGRPKAEAACANLAAYNPEISLVPHVERLVPGNARALVSGMNLVVDAADSLAVTYMLSDACRDAKIPLVSASVLEQRGYVGAFCGKAPSYRAVFPDMPTVVGSCAENGVMGSSVGVLGSLQAHMALQIIVGQEPSPLGRLVSIDLRTMTFGGFRFQGAAMEEGPGMPFVGLDEVTPDDHVIELRDEAEAPVPVTPDAVRILPTEIAAADLPQTGRIVLCCRSGIRAMRAANVLAGRGFKKLAVLAAGD